VIDEIHDILSIVFSKYRVPIANGIVHLELRLLGGDGNMKEPAIR
jgi:hypothetical protein